MLLLLITLKQDKCKAAKCFGVYFETFWLATYLYSKFYKTYFSLYIWKYMSLDHVYQILDNALIIFDIKTFTDIWYPTFFTLCNTIRNFDNHPNKMWVHCTFFKNKGESRSCARKLSHSHAHVFVILNAIKGAHSTILRQKTKTGIIITN